VTLVDTSVWVNFFRAHRPVNLESLVEFDDIVTCPPVIQEVLSGFRDEAALRRARESMLALPILDSPLPLARYLEAAELFRRGRRAGLTIRSPVDCLIGAIACAADVEVLHTDRDFVALAKISPLRQRSSKK